jgi:hypothetical protein
LNPLDVLAQEVDHWKKLEKEERAKGPAASLSRIKEYMTSARQAAVELAPYLHPKLAATTTDLNVQSAVKVIASPELCETNEEWLAKYVPRDLRAKSPTEIDGEVVASATAASPTPQPASTAVELYDPDKFQLEIVQNRYFRLRRADNPSQP